MTKAKFPRRKPSDSKRLWLVVECLQLEACKRCWHFHLKEHICWECGFDNSIPAGEQQEETSDGPA